MEMKIGPMWVFSAQSAESGSFCGYLVLQISGAGAKSPSKPLVHGPTPGPNRPAPGPNDLPPCPRRP